MALPSVSTVAGIASRAAQPRPRARRLSGGRRAPGDRPGLRLHRPGAGRRRGRLGSARPRQPHAAVVPDPSQVLAIGSSPASSPLGGGGARPPGVVRRDDRRDHDVGVGGARRASRPASPHLRWPHPHTTGPPPPRARLCRRTGGRSFGYEGCWSSVRATSACPSPCAPSAAGHDVVGYEVDEHAGEAAAGGRDLRRGRAVGRAGRGPGHGPVPAHRRTRRTAPGSTWPSSPFPPRCATAPPTCPTSRRPP